MATKLINLRPYRMRVMHRFKPTAAPQMIRVCNLMLKNVHDGLLDPQLLFVTDEAYFHVSGYVNYQKKQIWSGENPHTIYQIPLHYINIGM
jgi:hypothetical protein